MSNSQLMELPTTAIRSVEAPARGMHLLEHPRGRGFSVVSRLAREVQPTAAPRHRREDTVELIENVG